MTSSITATILGATGSGKSTYLLGMYAKLSQGFHQYFLLTRDPDVDLDLADAWDLLSDTGELPPPTAENQDQNYRFVLKHGVDPLIEIDWMDYRGGAIRDRNSAQDTQRLRARLDVSDSVYIVLDGGNVAEWLTTDNDSKASRGMEVRRISTMIQNAVDARRARELPAPALVVLLTKIDLVRQAHGALGPVLAEVVKRLDVLLPVAFSPGVTALVCPVQLGDFGPGRHENVDPRSIKPIGLHRPMIFSFMHHLTVGVEAHDEELNRIRAARGEVDAELNRLRGGFLKGFFKQGEIAAAQRLAEDLDDQRDGSRQDQLGKGDRIEQLSKELEGHPVIRDGKVSTL